MELEEQKTHFLIGMELESSRNIAKEKENPMSYYYGITGLLSKGLSFVFSIYIYRLLCVQLGVDRPL